MSNSDTKAKQHFKSIAIGGMALYALLLSFAVLKDVII